MSLNLTCDEVQLWQTPTDVTLAIMKKTTWQSKIEAYKEWVLQPGSTTTRKKHIQDIDDAIKRHGRLTIDYI